MTDTGIPKVSEREIRMPRIAIVSDIHGNAEAFEAVLAAIGTAAPDTTICLGDVVGYGPDPARCLDLAQEACDSWVVGNHDLAAIAPLVGTLRSFNDTAKESIYFTRSQLTRRALETMANWPRRTEIAGVLFTHASFAGPGHPYISSREKAHEAFSALDERIGVVGHTHIPSAFSIPETTDDPDAGSWDIRCMRLEQSAPVTLAGAYRFILNPGSVGQPRDRNPDASWGILDTDAKTFQVHREPYDVAAVERKIRQVGLPDMLGERLHAGT